MGIRDTKLALQAAGILNEHKVLVDDSAMVNGDDPWYRLVDALVQWKLRED